jgi:hypothetical protein
LELLDKINFLLSASVTKQKKTVLNKQTLKNLVFGDYSQAYNLLSGYNPCIIFRGDKKLSNNKIYHIVPGQRKSEDMETNYYTELLSNILPSWNDYPKRDQGVICTTNADTANNYGKSFIILPKNYTDIGICPNTDIWYSFSISGVDNLYTFNNTIYRIISESISYDVTDIYSLIENFNKIPEIPKKYFTNCDYDLYKNMYEHNDNLLEFFDNIFNPEENGFELMNMSEYNIESNDNDNELWFSNEYISIPYNMYNEIQL